MTKAHLKLRKNKFLQRKNCNYFGVSDNKPNIRKLFPHRYHKNRGKNVKIIFGPLSMCFLKKIFLKYTNVENPFSNVEKSIFRYIKGWLIFLYMSRVTVYLQHKVCLADIVIILNF